MDYEKILRDFKQDYEERERRARAGSLEKRTYRHILASINLENVQDAPFEQATTVQTALEMLMNSIDPPEANPIVQEAYNTLTKRAQLAPFSLIAEEDSMHNLKPALNLAQASAIANGALAKAREMGYKPMTVAVVDAGGCLMVLLREDGSGILRPDIAFAKAWGAVGMGLGGRAMATRANAAPQFWAALDTISNGRIAPVPGGVLIMQARQVVGSVGMSGDLSDNDEACAIAGIQKAGFEAEVGEDALGKQ